MTTTEELQKFTGFIEELGKTAIDLKSQILTFKKRIEDGEWTTSQGISLLEVKYHILLEYITSLVGIIRLKLNGLSIENHPLIDNLIRNRVTLEKMKPIEQKLKYQIDKLVRASITNETTVNSLDDTNPYSFRPNPQQLAQEKEQEEEEKSGLYRAPRIAPVHYDEETKSDKRKKQQQRLLEKAAKSRLIQDLITEYDDRPEQQDVEGGVRDGYGGEDLLGARERERIRYEEENFTRLTLSKKEARRMRDGGLNRFTDEFKNLNDFSNLAGIQATEQEKRHEYSLLARRERRQHEREQNANRKRKGGVDGIMSDDDEDGSELGAFQRARRREVRRKMRKRQRK